MYIIYAKDSCINAVGVNFALGHVTWSRRVTKLTNRGVIGTTLVRDASDRA